MWRFRCFSHGDCFYQAKEEQLMLLPLLPQQRELYDSVLRTRAEQKGGKQLSRSERSQLFTQLRKATAPLSRCLSVRPPIS